MTIAAHLNTLENKHAILEKEIDFAFKHFFSDESVRSLKKRKLNLKNKIEIFKNSEATEAA